MVGQGMRANERRRLLKIQYYMHENLKQGQWIFWITLLLMATGFLAIVCGIVLALQGQAETLITVTVTAAGALAQLIGATFLIVYKSTMEQARDYINILDRIHAGYRSSELIKKISCENERNQAYSKAALEVLSPFRMATSDWRVFDRQPYVRPEHNGAKEDTKKAEV
jgi:hypothetical protein